MKETASQGQKDSRQIAVDAPYTQPIEVRTATGGMDEVTETNVYGVTTQKRGGRSLKRFARGFRHYYFLMVINLTGGANQASFLIH